MINPKGKLMNHTIASVAVPAPACKENRHCPRGLSEATFRKILYFAGLSLPVLLIAIFFSLLVASVPALRQFGFGFLLGKTWDPVRNEFGAVVFLVGTLMSSFLALLMAMVFSLPVSIFLGEYFRHGAASTFMKSVIELLAGIPSVIYGFWGLFLLVPLVRELELMVGVAPQGVGIFTASLVLAVMIIPYASSIGTEVISLVPADLKEGALSLGATRFEVIRKIILPYASSGIFAGVLLALGRALGETMAVTMVIGNSYTLTASLFAPGTTIASKIASEFSEASSTVLVSSLVALALALFGVTLIVNIAARLMVWRITAARAGGR